MRAVSRTVQLSTPLALAPSQLRPLVGPQETRLVDGFRPNRPQNEAGMRIEPPPSLAPAMGTTPAATAAAAPPEEPPGVRVVSQGLRVGPQSWLSVCARRPISGVAVRPKITSPACRQRLV